MIGFRLFVYNAARSAVKVEKISLADSFTASFKIIHVYARSHVRIRFFCDDRMDYLFSYVRLTAKVKFVKKKKDNNVISSAIES